MTYIESFINRNPLHSPTIAAIKRPDGRVLTSTMLGELNGKSIATLNQVFDVALATLAADGSVRIAFPRQEASYV